MSKRAAVLIIHGMGDQKPGFASDLTRRLKDYLQHKKDEVAIAPCYWADLLQNHEDLIWERIQSNEAVRLKWFRDWVISALGDPPGYLSGYFKTGKPVYRDIHERIRLRLAELERELDPSGLQPLVILAHSLGSVIITNYLWDEQGKNPVGTTPFERLETLTKLITYGSNIPLFIPPVAKVECVRFPSPRLSGKLRPHARWKNFFAPADLLGYPLNDIWDESNGTTIEDISIHPGPFPLSHLPFSHSFYDSDDEFLAPIAREILSLLEAH